MKSMRSLNPEDREIVLSSESSCALDNGSNLGCYDYNAVR